MGEISRRKGRKSRFCGKKRLPSFKRMRRGRHASGNCTASQPFFPYFWVNGATDFHGTRQTFVSAAPRNATAKGKTLSTLNWLPSQAVWTTHEDTSQAGTARRHCRGLARRGAVKAVRTGPVDARAQGTAWWVGSVGSASQRVLWAHGLAERVKRVDSDLEACWGSWMLARIAVNTARPSGQ